MSQGTWPLWYLRFPRLCEHLGKQICINDYKDLITFGNFHVIPLSKIFEISLAQVEHMFFKFPIAIVLIPSDLYHCSSIFVTGIGLFLLAM